MADASFAPIHHQIARVSRRLTLQRFVDSLVWCWVVAMVLAVGWFLVQPLVLEEPAEWLRWAVAGGLVGVATLVAVFIAWLRAPSRVDSALSLDEKFGLKERVTTTMTLTPEQTQTPAGQALLADVLKRVKDLDIGSRFPVQFARTAGLIPMCVAGLICVALFYEPSMNKAAANKPDDSQKPPVNKPFVDAKMEKLKKPPEKRADAAPRSDDIEKLEAKLEEIANRPRDTKEQLRERLKEMTALEEMMKKQERDLSDRNRAVQQQLNELGKNSGGQEMKDGPGKDLQKALSEGNLEKAKSEIEKLAKKLKDNELTRKEKEQLANQMKDLANKLEKLAKQEKEKDKLDQLKREGKLSQEAYDKEMKDLQKDMEKLKDLNKLAQKLKECENCLKNGDGKMAQKALDEARDKIKDLDQNEKDLKDLKDQLDRLDEAKDAGGKGLKGDGKGDSDQPNDGGIGEGSRPEKQDDYKARDKRLTSPFDPKGRKIFDGYAPGQNFKKKTGSEIFGDVKQASQEAPEAIEQQRIPKAARDMAKGYFKNLGNQFDKDGKKEEKK